jgi:hypothetical protein
LRLVDTVLRKAGEGIKEKKKGGKSNLSYTLSNFVSITIYA